MYLYECVLQGKGRQFTFLFKKAVHSLGVKSEPISRKVVGTADNITVMYNVTVIPLVLLLNLCYYYMVLQTDVICTLHYQWFAMVLIPAGDAES